MKTGINMRRCDVGEAEAHNRRDKNYVEAVTKKYGKTHFFPTYQYLNVSYVMPEYRGETLEQLLDRIRAEVKEKTGRKMQEQERTITNKKTGKKKTIAGSSPIREGICPIKPDTKIEDFKPFVDWLASKGVHVIRIDIHRDEGHLDDEGQFVCNNHAHVICDYMNHETGKSIKLKDSDMSEMQTQLANALGMERGTPKEISGVEHLNAIDFKIKQQNKRAKEAAENLEKIRSTASKVQSYGFQLMANNKALENQNSDLKVERDNLQSEAESLANIVQSARSDLHGLEARKNALDYEILMKTQEKEQAEKDADEARAKAKQAEATALSGLVVGSTKKIGNLLGLGKEAKQLKELPQQIAAAKEEGRTEGKKEAIAEVLKEAKLNFGDKEATPSIVGRAWRARFDEAEKLKNAINEKNKDNARELASYKKSNSILKELAYSIWDGAREAVSVLCKFLAYPHLNVSFGREEVATIDYALKNAQGIEERKAYGRDLVNLAHAEYPGYADDAHQLSQLRWKMDEVAERENRWQQNQGQSRGWHL